MQIKFETKDGITIAMISGEIDGKTSPEIQERILPELEKSSAVVLDLEEVTFMSSAGLRMLLFVYRHTQEHACHVALANLSEQIEDTMSITGFLGFFEVFPSRAEALKAVGA
jgi:anti-sigma B factor antagonist